jgi:hypothetical protein
MQNLKMTVVDLPMSYVYGMVTLGLARDDLRSVQVAMRHWRQGWSVLERPAEKRGRMNTLFFGRRSSRRWRPASRSRSRCASARSRTSGPPARFRRSPSCTGWSAASIRSRCWRCRSSSYAGNLMNSAGITNRIYNFALALVGWLKGGLGHVNVVGSVVFAGMSGTAVADAGGLGTIEIKAMKDHGYPVEFAVGITAASSTLGPIIPPSLPMVIYGVQANTSIGKLFAGRLRSGRRHGAVHDGHGRLLRARPEVRRRHRVLLEPDGPRVRRAGRGCSDRGRALHPGGRGRIAGRTGQVRRAAGAWCWSSTS